MASDNMAGSKDPQHEPSPGELDSQGIHAMRMPHLKHVYRIVCHMSGNNTTIPNVQDTDITRLILPIAGGTVSGPQIKGSIVPNSGADWAQLVGGEQKRFVCLDARYPLRTGDGFDILVSAKGIYEEGPHSQARQAGPVPTVTQDDVEYFTHLTFEAAGHGPYSWMNRIVAIGVMTMFKSRPIIDCYRLTNFPSVNIDKS
ncbi:uncharacterized protein B0I36DRAFT_432474 [Microdochium trichocladiopsis]|uniref:Uncharacterized protein n=1 Tax=Microdochium trichocladiopsis TaxID=1682393 RepID=A0A9P8Y7M4_9PEZI|nr:uncharacterized protein B0I36DRAFT_432474 [Microdochium trichocladiopsis]KAH7029878.1 hypothetical protein B0I36DRAFT_432474 [Microdochium trichocladiopsis]